MCLGNGVETCNSTGAVGDGGCLREPGLVENLVCTGSCSPGPTTPCSGNGVETCQAKRGRGEARRWRAWTRRAYGTDVSTGSCAPGQTTCSGTSVESCQANGNVERGEKTACTTGVANAAATCSGGVCGFACIGGYANCSGACVNEQTDNGNCGGCGTTCTTALDLLGGGVHSHGAPRGAATPPVAPARRRARAATARATRSARAGSARWSRGTTMCRAGRAFLGDRRGDRWLLVRPPGQRDPRGVHGDVRLFAEQFQPRVVFARPTRYRSRHLHDPGVRLVLHRRYVDRHLRTDGAAHPRSRDDPHAAGGHSGRPCVSGPDDGGRLRADPHRRQPGHPRGVWRRDDSGSHRRQRAGGHPGRRRDDLLGGCGRRRSTGPPPLRERAPARRAAGAEASRWLAAGATTPRIRPRRQPRDVHRQYRGRRERARQQLRGAAASAAAPEARARTAT